MAKEPDIFPITLGKIVEHTRKSKKLTQEEFAKRIGVTQSTLSRIERGEVMPDALVFRKIAMQAGMSTDQLHETIDKAIEQSRQLVKTVYKDAPGTEEAEKNGSKEASQATEEETPWWVSFAKVAGIAGLGALVMLVLTNLLGDDN